MTEYYYCLEGEGHVELNDTVVAMRPGTTVMIPPRVHHRAVGNLKILNIVAPPFSSDDEYLV